MNSHLACISPCMHMTGSQSSPAHMAGQLSQLRICCRCRLAKALDEEVHEGLPIQKLATLNEFPGFSLQQWLQAKPQPNKARLSAHAATSCSLGCMQLGTRSLHCGMPCLLESSL